MCVLSILFVIVSIGNDLKITWQCVCVRAMKHQLRTTPVQHTYVFDLSFVYVCVFK